MKTGTKKPNKETPTVDPCQALARADVVSNQVVTYGSEAAYFWKGSWTLTGAKVVTYGSEAGHLRERKWSLSRAKVVTYGSERQRKRLVKPLRIRALSDAGKTPTI